MESAERDFLDKLYRQMRGKLLQYAYANLSSVEQAEDAVQETFKVASAKIEKVMESENPYGWLINALKLILRETKRRSAKEKKHVAISFSEIESQDVNLSTSSIRSELRIMELLYSGLVSRDDFELLKAVYIHGFSILKRFLLL